MASLRILHVPNEEGSFRQIGVRRPLSNLEASGLIEALCTFSLQLRMRRERGHDERHRQDLIAKVHEFQPNVILMQHIGATGLTDRHFEQMRASADFKLIYHEGDPYTRWLHPLPKAAAAAGRASDVTFTVGSGVFIDNFRRARAQDVRYAPHVFEPERYGSPPQNDELWRPFDVVVVANRNRPRFRGHPNWKDRIAFVEKLQDRFGTRLAIFGHGWTGPGAMGPVEPTKQDEAIKMGWISANWDHYATEPKYFSNRLPISMASGSIHATTYHSGYSELFGEGIDDYLIFGTSIDRLVEKIERYLAITSPSERISAGNRARAFAQRHYRQDDQVVSFLNFQEQVIDPGDAKDSWDMEASVTDEI